MIDSRASLIRYADIDTQTCVIFIPSLFFYAGFRGFCYPEFSVISDYVQITIHIPIKTIIESHRVIFHNVPRVLTV
jgi:hypothetical protein